MTGFLKVCAEGFLALWLLKLAIEQGEFVLNWFSGWLWRGVEKAIPGGGREVGRAIAQDLKGKAAFAVHTVAEPFVEIARSFLPRFEIVREGAAPVIEVTPPVTEKPAVPSDEEYRLAVNKLGVTAKCSEDAARKGWNKLLKTDPAAADEAWAIISAKRNFRRD